MTYRRETLPDWAKEMVALYESDAANQFVLHGNIHDRFLLGTTDGTTSGGGKQITITGAAISKEAIADFQNKLNESGMFSDVFIPAVNQADRANSSSVFGDAVTDATLTRFSIVCTLL